jgi:NitT/TauT family transport system substrate-binding protein
MLKTKSVSPVVGRTAKLTLPILLILALLATIMSGCTKEEPKPVHLKVVTLPYIPYVTYYIAQEEGYFAEQGLDVEFVPFSSVTQALPLLVEGDLDVAGGSISAGIFNAVAQNMNIKIVAGSQYSDPVQGNVALMVRKDLYASGELDTVPEIKGRQVVVPCTGCINDFAAAKILQNAGLTLSDIKIATMSPQDTVAAFANKAIEAAVVGSLQQGQLDTEGYAVTLESLSTLMPGFQYGFVMFGPSLLKDNPEAGKQFMIAYLKAARQYMQGKTERNLEIAQKYLGMDRETLLQSPWPPVSTDGTVRGQDVLDFQNWAYENGLVDKEVPADQLLDTTFIDYANKVLGPAPSTGG